MREATSGQLEALPHCQGEILTRSRDGEDKRHDHLLGSKRDRRRLYVVRPREFLEGGLANEV
jgi:hypothetical protein